jgi:hypothetical protein
MESQTGVVSMAAPAPLMELNSDATNATENTITDCMKSADFPWYGHKFNFPMGES